VERQFAYRDLERLALADLGFDREEEEIKVINGQVTRVPVRRYYPPNAQAAAFWARHKMQWGEDMPPPTETTDETKPVEIRQVARQVARLLHLANKPETQQ
jgi:exonuclease III